MDASRARIDWVDYTKGFCIIFVVMMHSTLGVEKAAEAQGWMHALVQFAKPFRMPDFFMISGLFLGLVIDRPWRRYLDRKVVHFFYFYVLWLTIQFAFKAPASLMGGDPTLSHVVASYFLAFIEPFGTLWFIYLLPVFFVVTRLTLRLPWWLVLGAAAALEIAPIQTGSVFVDEFASRFVYFYCGYFFAARLFALAAWGRANAGSALALLGVWAIINGVLTFAPAPAAIAERLAVEGPVFWSDLPLMSLALGAAGAVAVVLFTALLSTLRVTSPLRFLGRNSIVVYLAFFLPMVISRVALLRFAPFLDIGTVSLIVTACGVIGPVIMLYLVQWTGYGRFLFERPQWARLESAPRAAMQPQLSPAE